MIPGLLIDNRLSPMKPWILSLCLLFLAPLHAEITLCQDGVTSVVIVVPVPQRILARKPWTELTSEYATVARAAAEVAHYLKLVTGTAPIIVPDTEAPAAGPTIFIGHVPQSASLLHDKPLQPEEYLVRTMGPNIHLLGGDLAEDGEPARGTWFAACEFLETVLGVRWLYPGAHGEVVPAQRTLIVGDLDIRSQPPLQKRRIRNVAISREDNFAPVLEKWGISLDTWKAAQGGPGPDAWYAHQRLGQRMEIQAGHAYEGWDERYHQTHPEFFALQPDGTRKQTGERERLCKSNPALWDAVAAESIAKLKADPKLRVISISPNDGGKNKFCMCAACRALDPAEAPQILNDSQLVDPATGKAFPSYPSLSDRVFTFYNEVANRIHEEMPDRLVGVIAYSVYRDPPVRLKTLAPNLVLGYVGMDRGKIEAWSKLAPRLFIRPNDLGPSIDLGLPRNHAVWFAESVKFGRDHHAIAFDFDNGHGNWGGHGLDYYVLAKALWNPDIDPRAVIDDYCRNAYGPAAADMQAFWDRLEKVSDAVRADSKLATRSSPEQLLKHYNPEVLSELETHLAQAFSSVGKIPEIHARIRLAADAVTYARLVTSLIATAAKPGGKASPEYATQLSAVEEHLKNTLPTQALASLHSHRYLRMALAYVDREVE